MPIARFVSTEGPYLEAKIEIDGVCYSIMDEFSVDERNIQRVGAEFEFEFAPCLGHDESWENIFAGNPQHKVGLEHVSGWSYRAFGKIVSINPVVVDCGILRVEDVISTHNPKVIGEFVAFTISRLGGYAYAS